MWLPGAPDVQLFTGHQSIDSYMSAPPFAPLSMASGPSMVSRNVAFTTPKALGEETVVSVEDGDVELQTVRNDALINSFNPSSSQDGCCRLE